MAAKTSLQSFADQNRADQRERTREETNQQDVFASDDPVVASKQDDSGKLSDAMKGMKREKLAYIHEMLNELRKLSIDVEETMVAYLIEMALLETDTAIKVGDFQDEFSGKPESNL